MAHRYSVSQRFFARRAGMAFLLCLAGGACSGAADPGHNGGSDSGGAQHQAGGGGNSGDTGQGGLFDGTGPGSGGSTSGGFEQCATSSQEATLVPLNMIIMFDRSGSMQDNNKWRNATAALKAFVSDPESAGLRVALRFFPDDSCNDDTCDVNACSTPKIDAAPLTDQSGAADPQEQALVSAISHESPNGSATPLYAALAGAEQWATKYLAAHAAEKAIVILVTDGQPNGCDESTSDIAGLAADAQGHGVLTYGVGLVGSEESIMDQIADKGGTSKGIFIGNGNAQADLLAALKKIQGSQVACEFKMPKSQNGEPIDPTKINVKYTTGSGKQTTFGQVAHRADCNPATGGWYYDDPSHPNEISFCPSTCQVVQADPKAKIEIVVGCATMPAQ